MVRRLGPGARERRRLSGRLLSARCRAYAIVLTGVAIPQEVLSQDLIGFA